jgi:hypothetical protein
LGKKIGFGKRRRIYPKNGVCDGIDGEIGGGSVSEGLLGPFCRRVRDFVKRTRGLGAEPAALTMARQLLQFLHY